MSRSDPTRFHLKLAMRQEFYRWAADHDPDGVVLDLGCGDGGGAGHLARTARHVLAVDIDGDLLRRSREAVGPRLDVTYALMDAEKLAIGDEAIDVAVAVAFLEYVPDPRLILDEALRVLRPGGLFMCVTTNATLTPKDAHGGVLYRDHVEEFTPEELHAELGRRFESVRLFGAVSRGPVRDYLTNPRAMAVESLLIRTRLKHAIPIRIRNFLRGLVTGVDVEEVIRGGFAIEPEHTENSIYVAGIGRKPSR